MAAIRGALLFGLSRLNERASPNCARTYCSVRATAPARSWFLAMNAVHAIDSPAGSYNHNPTSLPRSKMAWLGRSSAGPLPLKILCFQSGGSTSVFRSRRRSASPSMLLTKTY